MIITVLGLADSGSLDLLNCLLASIPQGSCLAPEASTQAYCRASWADARLGQ
jgi:hypothetical protein